MKLSFFFIFIFCFINLSFAQDDEAIVEEIQEARTEQGAQYKEIQDSVEKIEEVPSKITEKAIDFGNKVLTLDDLMSEKFQKMLEETLKDNPLKKIPFNELKQTLLDRSAGQPVEKLFIKFPVTLDITADLVRDDKAVLGLIRLMKKKDALINYSAIWIVLFLSFWMLKKRIAPKNAPFVRRTLFKLSLSLLGSFISFSIFYFMFKEEISPTLTIFVKHLL